MDVNKNRIIAFYLPQFHPIPENDEWWGRGFTEWTNVGKARPMFRNHYQPHIPGELGYYDLRLEETRIAQAKMATEYGVDGFAYWHYWFGGKRILERPFNEVLYSGKPDFPFCLAWANETWSGIWHGNPGKVLIEQSYPGREDYLRHYEFARTAFLDNRYMKVDNCPIFMLYRPNNVPGVANFINYWNELAIKDGFNGIHFIALSNNPDAETDDLLKKGFSAVGPNRLANLPSTASFFSKVKRKVLKRPFIMDYKKASRLFIGELERREECYPSIIPGWDNSPRSGNRAMILTDSSPEDFYEHVKEVLHINKNKKNKIILLKSWNEWAEGNYMEPDVKFGRDYLEALQRAIKEHS
ncbi:glycoside hydrolase family 99-like domain-containing protein [Chitinophaga sp. Ak27]|uniref:glycosyltransferase WbsX family protein n=1 Tax=Chitinophaga sp. Ak27 TaxID=2726116 RepID=UPI001B7D1A51|nr:glycoside hydrolase family 99-like domain-containing protein [Chitinophaga sp. Ak27]